VTGGRKRVGAAVVRMLRDEGIAVLFTTREASQSDNSLSIDIASDHAAHQLRQIVDSRFAGRLDVLVHNASVYEPGDLSSLTAEQLRRMNRVNVEAPILITQALAENLRQAKGHVMTMCDILADRPMPSYLAYCASKAALVNATKSLARSLAPDVAVNGIAPGVVDWPDDMPAADREKYLAKVPLKRAGTPEDVAKLVRFLITDGRYITGQVIPLDGGRSIT
jgi:pteridine reductase